MTVVDVVPTLQVLQAKNREVETAVEDLVDTIQSFPLDAAVTPAPEAAFDAVRLHYNGLMYKVVFTHSP